jgi:hypothetical protein
MKKIIITSLLYNIKKVTSIYFLFTVWKKIQYEKRKKIKEKKKIKNILKWIKLKGKKLVAGVLDAAMLCAIHVTTIENTLCKEGDDTKLQIHSVLLTQLKYFYICKKKKNCYWLLWSGDQYASYYIIT